MGEIEMGHSCSECGFPVGHASSCSKNQAQETPVEISPSQNAERPKGEIKDHAGEVIRRELQTSRQRLDAIISSDQGPFKSAERASRAMTSFFSELRLGGRIAMADVVQESAQAVARLRNGDYAPVLDRINRLLGQPSPPSPEEVGEIEMALQALEVKTQQLKARLNENLFGGMRRFTVLLQDASPRTDPTGVLRPSKGVVDSMEKAAAELRGIRAQLKHVAASSQEAA